VLYFQISWSGYSYQPLAKEYDERYADIVTQSKLRYSKASDPLLLKIIPIIDLDAKKN
jgi:hypothetical protein